MTETEAIRENYNLGVLAGEARERQRIIELLEAISDPATPMGQLHIPGFQMREIIALIKGENK